MIILLLQQQNNTINTTTKKGYLRVQIRWMVLWERHELAYITLVKSDGWKQDHQPKLYIKAMHENIAYSIKDIYIMINIFEIFW